MGQFLGFKFKWSRVRNRFLPISDKSRYTGTDFVDLTRIGNISDIKNKILIVGNETYGKIDIFDGAGTNRVIIGNYCFIVNRTKFILVNHRPNFIKIYPFKFSNEYCCNIDITGNSHVSKGDIIIGSDVWIGVDSIIMSVVNIGDGAIMDSNNVVIKDVEVYSIMVGNPEKYIKYRVKDPILRKIKEIFVVGLGKERIHKNINLIKILILSLLWKTFQVADLGVNK